MQGRQFAVQRDGLAARRPALASIRRLTLVTTLHPRRARSRSRSRSMFSGVLLIALGAVFLLAQLGHLDVGDLLRQWWPMIIVALGVVQFVEGRGTRAGALTLIVVGCVFQVVQLGYLPWATIGKLWPVALIAVGASLLWKR